MEEHIRSESGDDLLAVQQEVLGRIALDTPLEQVTAELVCVLQRHFPEREALTLEEIATQLAAIALERKRTEERLREHAVRLEAFSRRLVEVQEKERRQLARELHDEIGQLLTTLQLALDASAEGTEEAMQVRRDEARALIAETLNRVRELSFDLRPAMLDHLGLAPALRWLVERYTTGTGVRVDFQHTGIESRLSPEVETAAYRIVQEALTNVARHAGVKEAAVRLWVTGSILKVQIEDTGIGFDPEITLTTGRASGLAGMQERLLLLGGSLEIEATLGSGTHLLAAIPLEGHPGSKIEAHFHRLRG